MRCKRFLLLGCLAIACALQSGWAEARDRYYFLGYGIVQVIDGETDTLVADIPVKGFAREADLSADRRYLYVTANRQVIHKIDLADNRIAASVSLNVDDWERHMHGFTLAADGKTAYGAIMSRTTSKGEVVIGKPVVAQFDLASGKILRSVEVPWGVAHLVGIKGGESIYAFGQDMYKIDTTGADMKIVETVPMFDRQMNLLPFWGYSFDNGGVASMNYYTPKAMGLLLVDQGTGDVRDLLLEGDPVMAYSVVLAPDRRKAYAVMDELTVIDLQKKTYTASVPIKEGTCYGVNVSSDGKKIYVGGGGSTVTVYDAQTLKPLKVLQMASDGMDLRKIKF